MSNSKGISLQDLVARLSADTPAGQKLFALVGVVTSVVRATALAKDGHRSLCVRDECDVDWDGNTHPAHAHIAACETLFPANTDVETDTQFNQAWADLCNAFRMNVLATVSD